MPTTSPDSGAIHLIDYSWCQKIKQTNEKNIKRSNLTFYFILGKVICQRVLPEIHKNNPEGQKLVGEGRQGGLKHNENNTLCSYFKCLSQCYMHSS